jgi:hypothetical protein
VHRSKRTEASIGLGRESVYVYYDTQGTTKHEMASIILNGVKPMIATGQLAQQ